MTTTIRNPAALSHALAHHAAELEPLVGLLALEYVLNLQPAGWELRQSGVGSQSFAIKNGSREYHLRGLKVDGKFRAIRVKDAYHMGREVMVIDTRLDVLKFVRLALS